MSILFITHDLGVIAEIADDVIVMFKGKIVEYGSILEIFTNPKHPYTRGLLACRPRLDTPYKRLPTVDDFMSVKADGEIVTKEMDDKRLHELTSVGRGRLLHPAGELEEQGYPKQVLETADWARDSELIADGTKPLLSVRDLKVHFPIRAGFFQRVVDHVRAVDGISFDVYKGQTLGLVGESGCGKTTIGRAILRLVPITSGTVDYDDLQVSSLTPQQQTQMRKRMQIIFQDPYGSLNPRMTVESALVEPMTIHGIGASRTDRRARATDLLEEVGLSGAHLRRYPHEFSGGQRQRICIARALTVEPEFLICDESVSALDVSVQAQVLNLLNELQERRQLTYIFISHDLSVVKFMADMMAVMYDGRIVEFGPSEAIYADPKEEYTRKLISATPKDDVENIKAKLKEREVARKRRLGEG
jgi:peptide/nickel transport system ATP-binding protein